MPEAAPPVATPEPVVTENVDEQASADFDIDTPDIPLPDETPIQQDVIDTFEAGFKYSFVGAGQGGSRLAETFYKLGYKRTVVINTAEQDLVHIEVPEANKLCLGSGGAGKDPAKAKAVISERKEDVLDFMRKSFGPSFDRIIVCAGAGGGTGAGTVVHLVDIAMELQKANRSATDKVGVILALPKISEGNRVALNAYNTLISVWELVEKGTVSPLILVDNEKISQLYPRLAVDPFWNTANMSVCQLFHLFNTITIKSSHYSSFDRADMQNVLDSGLITYGACPVLKWEADTDISGALRNNLKKNILSGGVDIETGSCAASVIIGGQNILNQIPQTHLDHGFEQLTRMLKPGSTVHRGIYRGNKENLVAYTVIGGVARPSAKLAELKTAARMD